MAINCSQCGQDLLIPVYVDEKYIKKLEDVARELYESLGQWVDENDALYAYEQFLLLKKEKK